jgi:hypothetical protein
VAERHFIRGIRVDVPNADEPTNIPMMNNGFKVSVAFRRENFFQIAGNHREKRIARPDLFVSEMEGKEIQGDVPFLNRRDMTSSIRGMANTTGKVETMDIMEI